MTNKICIYAICKNEMKFAAKWLDSMSEADYIVILDTGSTDGTYEFFKNDPRVTRVEQKEIKPWRFDVARNESMKLVPDDANILFSTDLDELLEPGWGDLIRANWTENTWRGHYRYIWSHTADGSPGETFWYDKMHIRGYQWHFAVHEVLLPPGGYEALDDEKNGHLIDFGNAITLHHYPDQTKSRSSYLDLLKLRVKEQPEETYGYYLLGREYGNLQQFDEAIKNFEICLSLPTIKTFPLVRYCVLGYLGDIYCIKGDTAKATQYYNKQLFIDKTYREPYYNLANIYNQQGLYEIALTLMQEGLKNGIQHFDWTERSVCWREGPYDIISIASYFLGKTDLGIENAIRALQFAPMDKRIQKNYLALLDQKSQSSK